MKNLLLLIVVIFPFICYSQTGYESARNNGVNMTTERYVINSPGNTPSTSVTTWRVKDSTYIEWLFRDAYLRRLPNTVNDGNPVNFLHTDANGRILSSSISWLYPDTLNIFPTKYYLDLNFYDKSESDAKYLQSYTETDPTVASYIKAISTSDINYWNDKLNPSDTSGKWLPISYVPTWTSITGKPSFVTVATTGSYHNLIDTPLISATDISNWNTTYSWGNPSGVYTPLTRTLTINGTTQDLSANRSWTIPSTDTLNLSNRINTKQNISDTNTVDATRYWVNTQGFLKGVDTISLSNRINLKMNYSDTISLSNRINTKFTIPTGTTSQYVRGDGTLATFPTIPSQANITGGQNTKVTGTYPNITVSDSFSVQFYNRSGRINQSGLKVWADTLTPNTGNGYSIDISSAGFTNILSVSVVTDNSSGTSANMRNVEIKTVSTTAIVVNIITPNALNVSLLGLTLLGVPNYLGANTGTKIHVTIIGY